MNSSLAAALVSELGDEALRDLALRLQPFLPQDDATSSELITTKEASKRLRVHEGTVARLAREGRIVGARKLGRSWRFDPNELIALPTSARLEPPNVRRPRGRPVSTSQRVVDAIRGA